MSRFCVLHGMRLTRSFQGRTRVFAWINAVVISLKDCTGHSLAVSPPAALEFRRKRPS